MSRKKIISIAALLVLILAFTGCTKDKKEKSTDETQTPVTTAEVTKEPEPMATQEVREGQVRSKLTNEWVAEEKGTKRPYAIMLSNIKAAAPQSGIGQASIVYECLVEGGITRLMGIFEEFDAEKIGSVRSARHYYVSLADEYDAIFCHYGESKYTDAKVKELGVDNLSGLTSIGETVYYRSTTEKAPHNAFASYEGIIKGTEKLNYRAEYRDNLTSHYNFYDEDTTPSSDVDANTVTLKFSSSYSPVFEYDTATKMYKRSQFGEPHVDALTNEQLQFKNLIVQYVKESTMDKVGRQDMELSNASGKGYYISDGKAVEITWKKNEADKTMSYYNETGEKLTVNTGKTYIALFPVDKADQVVIQ